MLWTNRVSRFAAALLGWVIVAGGIDASHAQRGATVVFVDRVETRAFADTRPIIGQMVATVESNVAARAAGVVDRVLFEIGERVRRGQPLVELDRALTMLEAQSAKATVEVAKAGVTVVEARLALAEQTFRRQEKLKRSAAFSESRYEDLQQGVVQARSELAQAQAQVANAEAELARVRYRVTHSTIVAPFDGVVTARNAQPGQYVAIGDVVAGLLDTDRMEIEAEVPGDLIAGLTEGVTVDAMLHGGGALKATVRASVPVQNLSTRTRVVRFSADLQNGQAVQNAVGQSVTVDIPVSASRQVLTVHKDALVQARDGWMVFVVEDGKAQPREVRLGQAAEARMEVLSGLTSGDLVVIRGNERLRPGQAVTAKSSKAS